MDELEHRIGNLERMVSAVAVVVLVWGPGSGGGEHYDKRVKIREQVKAKFPASVVRFSEELDYPPSLRPHERELYHLALCDVCVVLDTSKGAGEELAYFLNSGLAPKLFVLTDEKHKGASSFPASIRDTLSQVFYSEEEYKSCRVSEKVLTRVGHVAAQKLFSLDFG